MATRRNVRRIALLMVVGYVFLGCSLWQPSWLVDCESHPSPPQETAAGGYISLDGLTRIELLWNYLSPRFVAGFRAGVMTFAPWLWYVTTPRPSPSADTP